MKAKQVVTIEIDGGRFKNAVTSIAKGENMSLSGYCTHIGVVAQQLHSAVARGRINKVIYEYICEKAGLDKEEFLPGKKEEAPKEEAQFSSEDVKLLYRALSDVNRSLFDISNQLKELNGKTEALRVNGLNENVHLYDIKQQVITLNKELLS